MTGRDGALYIRLARAEFGEAGETAALSNVDTALPSMGLAYTTDSLLPFTLFSVAGLILSFALAGFLVFWAKL
ncbi:MAG: hypothetical protein ACFB20_09445 [Opitutales bacterium]